MPSADSKRLAKNTLFLYIRMFLVMGVSLFTSRVILNALGVNDFGIYNVVGGMVALFSVISGSLSASISRFITFELGTGNMVKLKQIFATSIVVQLVITGIIVIFLAPMGFWFLNHKMDIVPERMSSANWVLGFSILTFILGLLSVPYNACIIAHERMKAFAYVGLVEVILKLGVAYLIYAFKDDRLIFYAFLIFCVSLIIRIIYGIYCSRHFEESHVKIQFHKTIFQEMSSFAGWTTIGTSSYVLQSQGTNIILNLFFGTVVNAAYGIGNQVNGAISNFTQNFLTALNPQITKTYAKGDYKHLMQLIYNGTRLSCYLMWIIAIVILLNTNYILHLWLKEVPEFAIGFVKLFIIYSLCESFSYPMQATQAATGNMKWYQIIVGGCRVLVLPLVYLFLYIYHNPLLSLVIAIIISILMFGFRLFFMKREVQMHISQFLFGIILKLLIVLFLSYFISYLAIFSIPDSFGFFIIKTLIIFAITAFSIFFIGCSSMEREMLINKIQQRFLKKYQI
ncbi:MAG: oligosaccharide flippase family protein [Muribaculaceae bacterium]|nr:oligosaccharide flippase family protein [Muribaculaceae bacterium]